MPPPYDRPPTDRKADGAGSAAPRRAGAAAGMGIDSLVVLILYGIGVAGLFVIANTG